MYDSMKRRQLDLLWTAYQSSSQKPFLVLDGAVARETGYLNHFEEHEYMRVLDLDTRELKKDGAIVEATDHPAYGRYAGGFTPYRLTDKGRQMLHEAGYPIA